MVKIKFFKEENLHLEMHKVRIVQKLNLLSIDERIKSKYKRVFAFLKNWRKKEKYLSY